MTHAERKRTKESITYAKNLFQCPAGVNRPADVEAALTGGIATEAGGKNERDVAVAPVVDGGLETLGGSAEKVRFPHVGQIRMVGITPNPHLEQ